MEPRKRLVVAANAIPGVGGQGQSFKTMLEAVEGAFEVIRLDQTNVPSSSLSRLILRVPYLRRRRDWGTLASDVSFDRAVKRRMPRADLFQGAVGQCAESLAAAARAGTPTILDCVNTHIDDFESRTRQACRSVGVRSFIHPAMRERVRREYQSADLIRVMSRVAERTFLERGIPAHKLVVATPPTEVARFPVARFESSVFRIIFVGLIEPWKGFHFLLQAYEALSLKDCELVLWGAPGARATSKYLARSERKMGSIRIGGGFQRSEDLDKVYAAASVLVHPSVADGFGFVVAEAMASGLPVIVTDNTGAADLVTDGENGYVVPVGDVAALRDRISHLHRNRHLLPEMGARAREAVARVTPESMRAALVPRMLALT